MIILGINAYHGDASAALLIDGQLVAAVEEERLTRIKHCAGFPGCALRACLDIAGVRVEEVDCIAIARDPRARLLKKLTHAARMPRLALDRLSAQRRFFGLKEELSRALAVDPAKVKADVHRVEHHKAHLASSFFVSPFDEAALLSADGLGDFASTMWGMGRANHIGVDGAVAFPHSLGIYYTALTQYLGFWKYGDEYKVMGLAPYGEREFEDEFEKIVKLNGGMGFSLGLDYFRHHRGGAEMTWNAGEPVLGRLYGDVLPSRMGEEREPGSAIEQRHKNIAASMQARLEDAVLSMLLKLQVRTGARNLCIAGGVGFNCAANGKIFDATPFESVYIPPAAGDAGLAVGAAFYVWHEVLERPRSFEMQHAYWGPKFGAARVREALERCSGFEVHCSRSEEDLVRSTAKYIEDGRIVGWFQERMEFGPRALGNRSILVDPRRAEMKQILNNRVKHREMFRPFAPSILEERVGDFFEQTHPSPFMLMTYRVKPQRKEAIPGPTHVDGTGRLQTVNRDQNQRYWKLIREFEKLTGVPVLLNTSFNDNEPVVCTPEEAVDCFLRTKMDVLVLGDTVVTRKGGEEENNGTREQGEEEQTETR